jgi:hypothetical protein
MSQPLSIIIVEKNGSLKILSIKDFKEEELYKKCGFKKSTDFIKQTEWTVKYDSKKYTIKVYAKSDGRANSENKYDFPPPIDNKLFFGSCAIVASIKNENNVQVYADLTIPLWNKIYEKLFGGFEDLTALAIEDEEEEDELANVPKEKKTKQGYLKDGFVVDSSENEDESEIESEEESEECEDDNKNKIEEEEDPDCDVVIEDIGSELSEETYDYSTEDEK